MADTRDDEAGANLNERRKARRERQKRRLQELDRQPVPEAPAPSSTQPEPPLDHDDPQSAPQSPHPSASAHQLLPQPSASMLQVQVLQTDSFVPPSQMARPRVAIYLVDERTGEHLIEPPTAPPEANRDANNLAEEDGTHVWLTRVARPQRTRRVQLRYNDTLYLPYEPTLQPPGSPQRATSPTSGRRHSLTHQPTRGSDLVLLFDVCEATDDLNSQTTPHDPATHPSSGSRPAFETSLVSARHRHTNDRHHYFGYLRLRYGSPEYFDRRLRLQLYSAAGLSAGARRPLRSRLRPRSSARGLHSTAAAWYFDHPDDREVVSLSLHVQLSLVDRSNVDPALLPAPRSQGLGEEQPDAHEAEADPHAWTRRPRDTFHMPNDAQCFFQLGGVPATALAFCPTGRWCAVAVGGTHAPGLPAHALALFDVQPALKSQNLNARPSRGRRTGPRPKQTRQRAPLAVIQRHTQRVHSLNWSEDSRYLISCGVDGRLVVVDAEVPEQAHVVAVLLHDYYVYAGGMLADSNPAQPGHSWVVSGGFDALLRIWSAKPQAPNRRRRGSRAALSDDADPRALSTDVVHTLSNRDAPITCIRLASARHKMFVGSNDCVVTVWTLPANLSAAHAPQPLHHIGLTEPASASRAIWSLCCTAQFLWVATQSSIHVCDATTAHIEKSVHYDGFQRYPCRISLSPDGQQLVCVTPGGQLEARDAPTLALKKHGWPTVIARSLCMDAAVHTQDHLLACCLDNGTCVMLEYNEALREQARSNAVLAMDAISLNSLEADTAARLDTARGARRSELGRSRPGTSRAGDQEGINVEQLLDLKRTMAADMLREATVSMDQTHRALAESALDPSLFNATSEALMDALQLQLQPASSASTSISRAEGRPGTGRGRTTVRFASDDDSETDTEGEEQRAPSQDPDAEPHSEGNNRRGLLQAPRRSRGQIPSGERDVFSASSTSSGSSISPSPTARTAPTRGASLSVNARAERASVAYTPMSASRRSRRQSRLQSRGLMAEPRPGLIRSRSESSVSDLEADAGHGPPQGADAGLQAPWQANPAVLSSKRVQRRERLSTARQRGAERPPSVGRLFASSPPPQYDDNEAGSTGSDNDAAHGTATLLLPGQTAAATPQPAPTATRNQRRATLRDDPPTGDPAFQSRRFQRRSRAARASTTMPNHHA
ncbi:uncharacterized protein MONBRDRAFT_28510 [Monosiga brevicollis MX1]|uniref:Uncharacterized protein n=1 Tax=Monosiga brevicollis TaxID=81824 RepID=A9V8D5_MONBE|nr:uncharacterized protein MONBRDRAFT_28510 [Monosiga brevicollis MX1]EDQ86321.1 predicted protein [Monosiga brevicollis MX1]|eukprot:XP_001748991.1 hypothetical protein [Monosiga brevicollis MX1]